MINVEFLVVTYLVGLFVDWVFQLEWQATNKSKWGKNDDKALSFIALLSHSMVYATLTSDIVALLLKLNSRNMCITTIVLLISNL